MVSSSGLWEVVGGGAKGGVIVRTGKEISSAEAPARLATGALVRVLEHDAEAERMRYEKVTGAGPATGWVSTVFKGKDLLVKTDKEVSVEEAEAQAAEDGRELAMQLYCQRFGKVDEQSTEFLSHRKAFHWNHEVREEGAKLPEQEVRAALDVGTTAPAPQAAPVRDSRLLRCSHCQLPVGEMAYSTKGNPQNLLHGECLAQLVQRELQEEDRANEQKLALAKRGQREEYDIGWSAERIPRNVRLAAKLTSSSVSQGMCCLVFDDASRSVVIAPTVEPAAAVNLEYLATALQVRRGDGREPLFSLDPADPTNPKESMQVKRFEPEWLAGTSVGEVLFQADYHLKELSMGEYEQPVVGMKSCHDLSDADDVGRWSAREWFVVRKAEVQVSDDKVLMPYVKMGIEAREQVLGERGLDDVPTTRPDHPAVQYAESFTHNFDLISERKSVVFHLRELAKASVMAKFLDEIDASLDDHWFSAMEEVDDACCLEVPQLWNDRGRSQIRVQDGKIVNADAGFSASLQRMYGGVQFGLDKFQLSGARQPARMMSAGLAARQFVQPARHLSSTLSAGLATRQFQRSFGPMGVQPARVSAGVGLDKFALSGARQPARMMSAGLAARQFVQPARHLSATLSAGLATRQFQRSFGPMGVQPARVAGVDLNLNEFNLSAPTQAKRQDVAGQLAEGIDISSAFWSNVEGVDNTMFSKEDQSLLQRIFNPSLSDRREEGDRFVPPDTSCAYIQGLRSLVREEEAVQKQRVQHFNSNAFEVAAPGALFPASWRSSVEISCEAAVGKRGGCLSAVDFRAQAQVFEEALQKATPVFDKSAEDGSRFRVYRLGSLEVRTTQEMHGKETISAVFSARASAETVQHFGRRAIEEHEKIVKVTEYVEGSGAQYRCYVVAETERKNLIVTEVLNGAMKREENPKDLEDRNSLAKVLRTAECGNSGITVASLKKYQGDVYGRLSGQGAQSGLRTA